MRLINYQIKIIVINLYNYINIVLTLFIFLNHIFLAEQNDNLINGGTLVRVGSLTAIDSKVTVVTTTHPPILQTHPPGPHTQVIIVADTNTKSQVC